MYVAGVVGGTIILYNFDTSHGILCIDIIWLLIIVNQQYPEVSQQYPEVSQQLLR